MTEPKSPSRAEETEEKIRFAYDLLRKSIPPGQIKRLFGVKFHVDNRAAERFITKARERMREEAGLSVDDHFAEAWHTYKQILADTKSSAADKIRAQDGIDKLTGARAAIKIDSNNATQVTVSKELTPAEERALVNKVLDGTLDETPSERDPLLLPENPRADSEVPGSD